MFWNSDWVRFGICITFSWWRRESTHAYIFAVQFWIASDSLTWTKVWDRHLVQAGKQHPCSSCGFNWVQLAIDNKNEECSLSSYLMCFCWFWNLLFSVLGGSSALAWIWSVSCCYSSSRMIRFWWVENGLRPCVASLHVNIRITTPVLLPRQWLDEVVYMIFSLPNTGIMAGQPNPPPNVTHREITPLCFGLINHWFPHWFPLLWPYKPLFFGWVGIRLTFVAHPSMDSSMLDQSIPISTYAISKFVY